MSDELWQRIEPLLPKPQRNRRHPGRKRIPDRKVLCGILFVLHTGIQWEFLPQELGEELGAVGMAEQQRQLLRRRHQDVGW